MKELSYAFLGMNQYGRKLSQTVVATGSDVMIADGDQDVINMLADKYTYAVCLDLSNPAALANIGLDQVDVVVVDLRNNLEAAIVSTMVAKEQGVERVIATASSDRFREVLERVGADEVVIPEDTAAAQMAKLLISADFMTYFDIGGDLCVIKEQPPREWRNKQIGKLELRNKHNVNIIAIEKDGEMNAAISAATVIPADCTLIMAIPKSQLYDMI